MKLYLLNHFIWSLSRNVFVYCKINMNKIYKLIVGLINIRLYIIVLIMNYELFGYIIVVVVVISSHLFWSHHKINV